MYVGIAVLIGIGLVVWMVLRKDYRRKHHEPARSCLAPNRSRSRNYYCQNATPRGGYCRIHHNQRAFDADAVNTAVVGAVVLVVLAVVVQVYTMEGLMKMAYDLMMRVTTALT